MQEMIGGAWAASACKLIDRVGLVHEKAPWFHGPSKRWPQVTLEVACAQHHVEAISGQDHVPQVCDPGVNGPTLGASRGLQRTNPNDVLVDGERVEIMLGEHPAVSSGAARQIERGTRGTDAQRKPWNPLHDER